MILLCEGKIADLEIQLGHNLDINAQSAEQGDSLGVRHVVLNFTNFGWRLETQDQ
jgi:hypothetical protein